MATKPKTFDCVDMKHKAQQAIMAEWEARRHEFRSYEEFLQQSIQQSEWGRRTWQRLQRGRPSTGD